MKVEPTFPKITPLERAERNAHYNNSITSSRGVKRDFLDRLKNGVDTMAAAGETATHLTLSGYQFEELLERGERIFIIRTRDLTGTLNQFGGFARRSGKAVYLWQNQEGLKSLKVSDMVVPGSRRLQDALRYIADSPHYGVYGFSNFERDLDLSCAQYLKKIANARGGYDRKLFLLSEEAKLPHMITELATEIVHEPSRRLRLRDGRWVV